MRPMTPAEAEIYATYKRLSVKPQDWIRLARLRPELPFSRDAVDTALMGLVMTGNAHLVPDSNRKVLTADDHAAAIRIGGEDKNLLAFDLEEYWD